MDKIKMRLSKIEKSFPGVKALDGIEFSVREGTVHALCGENGAGKSTLMKIIMGLYKADKGSIFLDEKEVEIKSPIQARDLGISMIAQELSYVPELSVEENLFLGRLPVKGFGMIDWKKIRQESKKFLEEENLPYKPWQKLKTLTVSDIQILEIIKAVTNNAKIIIMDEPTSSITQSEVENLFKKIDELKQKGVSIIYISHKMDEVFRIADDISILRDGKVVASKKASEFDLESVISLMVGRKIENAYPKEEVELGEKVLEIDKLSKDKLFEDVDFYVKKGEIVGFAGLVGAGRTEVMRAVYGLDHKDSGTVKIKSKEVNIKNPADSIKEGLILLSESRKDDGIVPVRSVMENASLASLQKFIYSGFAHRKKERNAVYESFMKMNVKTPTLDTPISSLSGGNQQKVLLARWLLLEPDILILDEPTKGIDVGAKAELYKLMVELSKQGKTIIMITSDMLELLSMSDRVMVMHEGHQVGIIPHTELTQERVLELASG